MHQDLYDQPTPRQSQIALSAAKADLDNDQTDNDHVTTVKKSSSSSNKLFVHYNHEKRFRSFKRDLHQIHDKIIPRDLALDHRLIVGSRNRRDAKNLLIRKKPSSWLLHNEANRIQRKYSKFLGMLTLI